MRKDNDLLYCCQNPTNWVDIFTAIIVGGIVGGSVAYFGFRLFF